MRTILPRLLGLAIAVGVTAFVPAWWCGRAGEPFLHGDRDAVERLARGARVWLDRPADRLVLGTGSDRFDGEWYLIVHMAAALGFAQTALEHPELRARHLPLVERALDRMLLARGRRHDALPWGEDPIDALAGPSGHLAFLGYANLALSVHRRLVPGSRFAALNDRITEALARRFGARAGRLLDSYPDETYPADNAAALASIVVHDRATGSDHAAIVRSVLATLRGPCTDAASGLLYQRVDGATGAPRDAARASGTAMAAFVLGYGGRALVRPWWRALARRSDTVLGFGGVREYGAGSAASGDVDSGPVLLGFSVSASGFALASARRFGDRARFRSIFASAWLLGLPHDGGGRVGFVAGGPLGDALLFALVTAGSPP